MTLLLAYPVLLTCVLVLVSLLMISGFPSEVVVERGVLWRLSSLLAAC